MAGIGDLGAGLTEHGTILTFNVDKASYNQATGALENVNGLLNKLAESAVKQFAEAGLAVVGFDDILGKIQENLKTAASGVGQAASEGTAEASTGVRSFAATAMTALGEAAAAFAALGAAATAGMASLLNGVANNEIQLQELSRTLWTSQQQAMAFSSSMKVLGVSLQDLYLSPTLMQQYEELHSLAMQMTLPSDYASQAQLLQNTSLQLKNMQLEADYAFQWIGYYFTKYMSGPLTDLTNIMAGVNKSIVTNMPTWTKQVASVMVAFAEAGSEIWNALDSVFNYLVKLAGYIPGWAKAIGAGLALIAVSNPFFLLIEGIAAAVLAFNDLETYLKGGNSEFPGLWSWLSKVTDGFRIFGGVTTDATGAVRGIGVALTDLGNWAAHTLSVLESSGTLTGLFQALGNVVDAVWKLVGNLLATLGSLFSAFAGPGGGAGVSFFGTALTDAILAALKAITLLLDGAAKVAGWLADLASVKPLVVGVGAAFATWAIIAGILKGIAIATDLVTVATKAWAAAQVILDAAMDANPIGLIVVGVGLLAAAAYEVITNWKGIATWVLSAWTALTKWLGGVPIIGQVKLAVAELVSTFESALKWVESAWNAVMAFSQAHPILMAVLAPVIDLIANWKSATTWAGNAWDAVSAFVRGPALLGGVGDAVSAVTGAFKMAFDWIQNAWSSVMAFSKAHPVLMAFLAPLVDIVANWKSIVNWVGQAYTTLSDLPALAASIQKAFAPLETFFKNMWSDITAGVADAINAVISSLNDVINAIDKMPGIHIPDIPTYGTAAAKAAGDGGDGGAGKPKPKPKPKHPAPKARPHYTPPNAPPKPTNPLHPVTRPGQPVTRPTYVAPRVVPGYTFTPGAPAESLAARAARAQRALSPHPAALRVAAAHGGGMGASPGGGTRETVIHAEQTVNITGGNPAQQARAWSRQYNRTMHDIRGVIV